MKLPEEDLKNTWNMSECLWTVCESVHFNIVHLLVLLSVELFVAAQIWTLLGWSCAVYRRCVNRSDYTTIGLDMTSTVIPFTQFQRTAYEAVVALLKALFWHFRSKTEEMYET